MSDSDSVADPPTVAMSQSRRLVAFAWLSDLGASAQAAIPGLYAWGMTVAPAAWSSGAPFVAKVAAAVGVLALVLAPLMEALDSRRDGARLESASTSLRRPRNALTRARAISLWGLTTSSVVVWMLARGAGASASMDPVRGLLGTAGWALFAFASAGPSLRIAGSGDRPVAYVSAKARPSRARGDGAYIAVGTVLAFGMQTFGWEAATLERAVLVHLVTVACGVAILSATSTIALARHGAREPASRVHRVRRALPWVFFLVLLAASGAIVTFR